LTKLDRYVLRELLVPFLIGTLAVILMFQVNLLIFQLKNFSPAAVPILATLKVILYKTPNYLTMTLPVAVSLAASLAVSRIARESELTAMRAAGAPILRVVIPIVAFGVLVGALNFWIAEKLMPKAEREARQLMMQVGLMGAIPEFKNNVLINLSRYSASFGSVTRISENTLSLSDVLLVERPGAGQKVLVTAESGEYRDGVWRMRKTRVLRLEGESLQVLEPEQDMIVNERITIDQLFAQPLHEEMSTEDLAKAIREGKAAGFDTTWLQVIYHTHFSVPAACVVFALVAPIFAVIFSRSGGFVGVLLSIIQVFLYFNGYVIATEILGRNGLVSPVIAAWLPNAAFLVLGAFGLRRLE
jgi:lipopolysaccharide export system permease protein